MANVRIAVATRNAMLQALADKIDGGAASPSNGTLKLYTGTQPANADTGLSGNTLLATLTFQETCAASIASGVLTFALMDSDTSADNNGTATWARIADSAGATVFDGDVGQSGDGKTITMNSTTVVAGTTIAETSATLTYPAT